MLPRLFLWRRGSSIERVCAPSPRGGFSTAPVTAGDCFVEADAPRRGLLPLRFVTGVGCCDAAQGRASRGKRPRHTLLDPSDQWGRRAKESAIWERKVLEKSVAHAGTRVATRRGDAVPISSMPWSPSNPRRFSGCDPRSSVGLLPASARVCRLVLFPRVREGGTLGGAGEPGVARGCATDSQRCLSHAAGRVGCWRGGLS